MNDEAGGRRRWYVPDAYLPGDSSHGVESHESACVLNTGESAAPSSASPSSSRTATRSARSRSTVGPRRTRHVRLTDPAQLSGRRAAARRPVRVRRRERRPDRPTALPARHLRRCLHPRDNHGLWRVARSSTRRSSRSSSARAASASDPRVTNFGGGNTSAKVDLDDPITGEPRTVLAVKGSGGDLGTLTADGLALVDLDRLRAMERVYEGVDHEDDMVGLLDHARFGAGGAVPSIDTPLHGFLPARARRPPPSRRADRLRDRRRRASARRRTPSAAGSAGSTGSGRASISACACATSSTAQPELVGVVLGGHGVISWADTSDGVARRSRSR